MDKTAPKAAAWTDFPSSLFLSRLAAIAFLFAAHRLQAIRNPLCYKADMKAAALLFLLSSQAIACDWTSIESVDPMTDVKSCHIRSPSAQLSVFVYPAHIVFGTNSVYREGRDALRVRIDENEALSLGRGSTYSYFPPDSEGARTALEQIQTGERIRVSFLDYPRSQNGEAAICNLAELIRACQP